MSGRKADASTPFQMASRLANRVGQLEKKLAETTKRNGELAHEVRCLRALVRDLEEKLAAKR